MTNCIVTQHQWKDLKAWEDIGLPLSTTSNEAAKMFDALVTQLIGWYDDERLGGVTGTVKLIREADPEYVIGPLIVSTFNLGSHRPETYPQLKTALTEMEDLVKKKTINEWEMRLVEAIRCHAEGYPTKSIDILEEMMMTNPFDVFSLRMINILSITWGCIPRIKKVMERILPSWKPHMALYGYVQGMYAFCLNETQCYKEAEKYALKALEFNPSDCWSTHVRAHIMDGTNRANEGIEFMEKTEDNWKTGTILLEHNYWHLSLFYVEKGDYESALSIYDDHLLSQCTLGGSFRALRDGISLLYRLQLEGVPTGGRWHELNSFWCPSEHASIFNDVHMMMSHLGARDYDSANSLLESCNNFLRQGKGTNWEVTKEIGLSLCEALMAFDKGQYDDTVELLMPVRDDVVKIGGSGAQRDLFKQLLINAAICSSKESHRELGKKLVEERKKFLGETGVTKRLEERLFKQHGESSISKRDNLK